MAFPDSKPSSLFKPIVNIAFLIDTSGSMHDEIEGVKSSCIAFADTIIKEHFEVRLGLVGFDIGGHRGKAGAYQVHNLSQYTIGVWPLTSPQAFKQNIASLRVGLFGGGGCYLANADTVDIFPHVTALFKDTNPHTRFLVIISDEMGGNDGLPGILAQLKKASLTTYVLGVEQRNGAHEQLASKTGGKFWSISGKRFNFQGLLHTVAAAIAEESKTKRYFVFARPPFIQGEMQPYLKPWGSAHPGGLIILLDQSGTMQDKFGNNQTGAGKTKADMVATVLNGFLNELIKTNTVGSVIKPRAEVAVLGYEGTTVRNPLGGALLANPFSTLADLSAHPLRLEKRNKIEVGDDGSRIEIPVTVPIWVEPSAGEATPMCAALERACELAEKWAVEHLDSYPPVVINITDGASTDGDPSYLARELVKIYTRHGQALLFNCHLTNLNAKAVEFPHDVNLLPPDPEQLAPLLFSLSSIIPEPARRAIMDTTRTSLQTGARGFVFNGDALAIRHMFVFATVGASAFNPNR